MNAIKPHGDQLNGCRWRDSGQRDSIRYAKQSRNRSYRRAFRLILASGAVDVPTRQQGRYRGWWD